MPGVPEKNRGTSVLDVGPGFFSVMQIPILLGREIDERDGNGTARVAVVNEVFVKTYFGGRNPIGRHFGLRAKDPKDVEIIAVAKTARLKPRGSIRSSRTLRKWRTCLISRTRGTRWGGWSTR